MEDLLFDSLIKVVGHSTYKHALREITDFGCRYKTVHLRRNGSRLVIAVDGHGLPLLKHLSKSLRKCLGCLYHDLPTEYIAYGILYYLAFFFAIITGKLRKVLEAQTNRHLIASGSGNEIV